MSMKISQLSSVSVAALANEFLVNEAGTSKKVSGTQLKALLGGAGDVNSHVYVKADYSAVGDGTTDDTTAINNAIAAVASNRGQELVFEPGVYLVPAGITETKPGLVVRGIGARSGGPGQWGDTGVVIKHTTAASWGWTHNAVGASNDYDGGRFENIQFLGDSDCAGGLLIRKNFTRIIGCASFKHTTGVGFLSACGSGRDDASWNIYQDCFSQDDLVGFQCGENTVDEAASSEYHHCIANKTGGGGISDTGTGILIWDNAVAVYGGKFEDNDIGIDVQTRDSGGATIVGCRFESNASYDVALNRAVSGQYGTRNLVMCRANNILVGQYQISDVIIFNASAFGTITDNGTDTIIIGNGVFKTTRTSGTPTGGYSGELRGGAGVIWYNDAGTWKSVAVT